MPIVVAQNASLKVDGDNQLVTLFGLTEQDFNILPPGSQINPDLADPHSKLRVKLDAGLRSKNFQIDELGPIRIGVGGFYTVALDMVCLNYDHPPLTTQDDIERKLGSKLQGFISSVSPVVLRSWGAQGTSGVYDGGGAGRLEKVPASHWNFALEMLAENYGEIAPVITLPDGVSGRCLLCMDDMPEGFIDKLNSHIVAEWAKAHGSAPAHVAHGTLKQIHHSHRLHFHDRVEELGGLALVFEFGSASLECLIHTRLIIDDLPAGSRISFRDLERRGELPLDRPIGALLKLGATASPQLAMIRYVGGYFDPFTPLVPITAETAKWLGNEKFGAVVRMARTL